MTAEAISREMIRMQRDTDPKFRFLGKAERRSVAGGIEVWFHVEATRLSDTMKTIRFQKSAFVPSCYVTNPVWRAAFLEQCLRRGETWEADFLDRHDLDVLI